MSSPAPRPARRARLIWWVVAGLLISLGLYGLKLVNDAGAFKTLHPHFAGSCRVIPDLIGIEDMQIDLVTDTLYMAGDQRPNVGSEASAPQPPGQLWSLDIDLPEAAPARLAVEKLDFDFHPHGMGLWRDEKGLRLFVVNHGVNDTIELFDQIPPVATHDDSEKMPAVAQKWTHVKTIADPLLVTANDVAPVGRDAFYVTNDHGSRSRLSQDLESYTRMGRGNLVFFDGQKFTPIAQNLNFANGVRVSPDLKTLYLAQTLKRSIDVYERLTSMTGTRPTGELRYLRSIFLGTAPDNIDLDREGSLWIGAHPNLFQLKATSRDHLRLAPAQILRVRHPQDETPAVEEVYLGDGKVISAASVGVHDRGRLFLGSIYDDKILDCKMDETH